MISPSSILFVNTRPADRAKPLTNLLEKEGCQVLELPLLELKACTFSPELESLFHDLVSVQSIVVVSPTAVKIGMQYLQKSGISLDQLQHVQWIAVGQTTANCLMGYGVNAHVPEVETSEGMLSLPFFTEQKGIKKIAFWRGEGGRQFMMQSCLERHIEVLNIILYARALPTSSLNLFKKMLPQLILQEQGVQKWVCISSEASWKHWKLLCEEASDVLNRMHYLVLGTRLNGILQSDRKHLDLCFKITQIEHLSPKVISHALMGNKRTS